MSSYLSGRSFDYGSGLTEADSSGLLPISSPSASSDSSCSSAGAPMATLNLNARAEPHFVRPVAPGKDLRLMTPSHQENPPLPVRRSSAVFLTQFQEQMSQMKEAMDAVQKEILSEPPPKPRGRPPSTASSHQLSNPTYHSQIATTNGLVIKIRKGAAATKQSRGGGAARKGVGAKKKRKRVDEDIVYCREDSEAEEEVDQPRKRKREVRIGPVEHDDEIGSPIGRSGGTLGSWGTDLPLTVLRRIMGLVVATEGAIPFLVRASRVSRLWREASLDPGLWTSIDLSTGTGKVKDKYRSERNLIYFLENKCSEARTLNLAGWSSAVTPGAVDVLVRVCPHLATLNLSTCHKLSGQNVRSIAEYCTRLSSLDLSAVSSVYNTKNAVSPSGIGEAAEIFAHRLLHLSLASNCMGNLPQILTSLAENCGNLGVLDLSNINSPRRDAILIRIEQLQIGCPALKVLRLTNSDIVLGETSIKDQVSSPGFAKLEELSIAVDPKKSQGMDNNDLERIVKNAHRLRLLDARGCGRISDSGLVRLPAWDLEHLYLSGSYATKSSSDGLELIFRKWAHSFKEIDISWTPSEEAIALAVRALSDGEASALRSLDLSGSSISFDSVQLLLRTAPSLQSLNLTSCRALPRGLKRNYTTGEEVQQLRYQVSKV